MNVDDLLDDFDTYEEVECEEEHPGLAGNYCNKLYDHIDEHEDLAGNRWLGRSY